jgi:non-specific serine/threonine protein kinase
VCTGEGIERMDVLDLLTSLADKSLIVVDEQAGTTRYQMLETIRQYALDRLRDSGEEMRWRNRHLACFVALAEESLQPVQGPQQGQWIDRLAREIDNFRAALKWATEQKLASAFQMASALARSWNRSAPITELRDRLSRLVEVVPRDEAKRNRARALNVVGELALDQRDYDEAERSFTESLELLRDLDEPVGSVHEKSNLAIVAVARGQYAIAEPLLEQCADLARSLGQKHLLATNLANLAIVVRARGNAERAASLVEETLNLAREIGNIHLVSQATAYRGRSECRDGNFESAEASFVASLALGRGITDPSATMWALEGFAELALARRAPERATTIWAAAARLRDETGIPVPFNELSDYERALAAARALLGDKAFDQAWRGGRAMELEDAVRYAMSDSGDA